MPYQQLENLTSRKQEKVAAFLTAENMAGIFAFGLPAYIATTQTVLWLRLLILLTALILGLLVTHEIGGMAFYERVLWRLRGWVRRRASGATVHPAEFIAAPVVQGDRALPVGGPIRRATPPEAGPSPALSRPSSGPFRAPSRPAPEADSRSEAA